MTDWFKRHLVPEARVFWRWWSVRLNALGLAILAWVQFDPVSALAVWNMMPAAVREILPPHFLTGVALFLFALSMLARVVKQPALETSHGD